MTRFHFFSVTDIWEISYILISLMMPFFSIIAWVALFTSLFVAVTISLSAFLIFKHLSAYKNPEVSVGINNL